MNKWIIILTKSIFVVLIATIVIYSYTSICTADDTKEHFVENSKVIALEEIKSRREGQLSKTDIFHKLRVMVSGEVEQNVSEDGICLIVSVYNDAEYDVAIKNPVDRIRILLWENEHEKVRLPSRVLVPTIKDGRMYDEITNPYEIRQVTLNQKVLSKEEIEQRAFTISPKHKLEIEILINKKMKYTPEELGYKGGPLTPEQVKKGGETEPLPAGLYAVQLALDINEPYVPKEERRNLRFDYADFKVNLVDSKENQNAPQIDLKTH